MVDAALAYAAHGYPVFPLDPVTKAPIPRRDPDPTGKHPDGIPGTGGVYKASTNPLIIQKWWTRTPNALIGLPMGPVTGVWALDVDTDENHADNGVAAWAELTAEHGEIVAREHRTASEGLHLLFNYEQPIGCSAGKLPKGIEVKGKGGYIVVPPSQRKGRAYYVGNDIDPVAAPEWLIGLIGTRTYYEFWTTERPADLNKLAEALDCIPNDDRPWEEWGVRIGLPLFAATGGSEAGFDLFERWSKKASKYDEAATRKRWEDIRRSPPSRTGARAIFKLARKHGWTTTLTAPTNRFYSGDEARSEIAEIFAKFLHLLNKPANVFTNYLRFLEREFGFNFSLTWALRSSTGSSKTQIAIRTLANTSYRLLYLVPILELADKGIAPQFRDHGVTVAVWRGRGAKDPANPGKLMCLTPETVELAIDAHLDVNEACCKKCRFKDKCSYQAQKQQEPQVWVAANNILFHQEEALGEPDIVVIDESFWANALVGIKAEEMITVLLAAFNDGVEEHIIASALDTQPDDGGVQPKYLTALNEGLLHRTINQQWNRIDELREHLDLRNKRLLGELTLAHDKKQICEELRRLGDETSSGRLLLDHHKGQRIVKWRGKKEIHRQYQVPTLLLDATLPGYEILKTLHENVEIVADINVVLPESVFIRQVLDAPTTDNKLGGKTNEKHRKAARRHILKRWVETGRQETVVICQHEYEKWLRGKLPQEIKFLHYNNLVGLDDYKTVRLMLLIGRTQPGPEAVEANAGALTGAMPATTGGRPGFTWYPQALRSIRLKNGQGVPVFGDEHPDPLCEEVRWQICEAELLQAFGRARAGNRTAKTPLDVEMMFNTVLDGVTVNEKADWEEPSLLWETIAEGIVLTSRVDLMKAWPHIWANDSLAKRTVNEPLPPLPGWVEVAYQLAGPKMKPRRAYFDTRLVPDPRGWLEGRLGVLA